MKTVLNLNVLGQLYASRKLGEQIWRGTCHQTL